MSDFRKLLDNEVVRIAEQLICSSEEDEHGIFWKTLHRQPYGKLYTQVNEEIYNGVSGIALFFVSLYRYKKETRYLQIARKSIDWCIHYVKSAPERHYTFYTGAVGIIYALIKLFEATENKSYLNSATQLFIDLEKGITNDVKIDDLLSGNAGNLFVITYLYAYTGNADQYRTIKLLIHRIINTARISKRGLKWGYLNNALDSTTGMSHGASGIAHTLLEVARALDYSDLNWIAEKAFAFEDEYYSRSLASWIDMRISPLHKTNQDIIGQGMSFYLQNKRDVNTWAHGTSGMALSRLNAFTLLQNVSYKRTLEQSVNITLTDIDKEANFLNFTLSTGLGSWIELCLQAGRILNRPNLIKQATHLLLKALENRNRIGLYGSGWYADKDDPALMVGTAGIGHLYLQLLDDNVDSVLLPKIKPDVKRTFKGKTTLKLIKKKIYGKYLKRTSLILKKISPNFDKIYNCAYENNIGDVCKKIRSLIKDLPDHQQALALDVFKLELLGIEMCTNPDYNIYREQKFDYFKQQLEMAEDWEVNDFANMNFVISRHVKIIQTNWFWPLNNRKVCLGNRSDKPGSYYVIMRLEIDQLEEFYPNQFSGMLLKVLKKQRSFADLMELLKSRFAIEEEVLRIKLVLQLKSFIRQWFIEIEEK